MKLTDEDKKLINKLIKEMRKKKGSHHGITYWAGVNEAGKTYHSDNHACHAGLGYDLSNRGWPFKFIASRINWAANARPLDMKIVDAYLRWLTMSSPYASAFVIKGGVKCRKLGYVVVRTDIPANFMAGALISARQIVESFGQPVLMWWMLHKNGLHPSLAYCHGYDVSCGDHKNVDIKQQGNLHSAWNGWKSGKERILNFKRKKPINLTEKYTEGRQYSPQSNIFGGLDYYGTGKGENGKHPSYHLLPEIEKQTIALQNVGQKVSCNPFKAGLKKQVDVEIFSRLYAEALINIYGKDNK